MDAPDKASFAIERDGQEHTVDIARETIAQATGSARLDSETMAGWLQDNLDMLSGLALRKLDAGEADDRIVITAKDLAGA